MIFRSSFQFLVLSAMLLCTPSTKLAADVPTWLFALGFKPVSLSTATEPLGPSGVVKWHPGHYVTLTPFADDAPGYFQEVLEEISRYPTLRGVQKRYMWAALEKEQGQYDFAEIEADLTRLAARNKRLVILLQTKSFKANTPATPAYLKAAPFDGGTFSIDIGAGQTISTTPETGTNIKLWNPDVRNRLIALVRALGERFNDHPHLEAVALTETAMGPPSSHVSITQQKQFFENLLSVNRAMREAFPNTVILQFVNYPRFILDDFIGGLAESGVGLGGPDIFLDDPGLVGGVYPYYAKLAGAVPLAPSVQHENYYTRRHRGTPDAPSVEELYAFARHSLKANYLFWTRRMVPPEKPYARVLKMLESDSFPKDAAGGLSTECPRTFLGCHE